MIPQDADLDEDDDISAIWVEKDPPQGTKRKDINQLFDEIVQLIKLADNAQITYNEENKGENHE